MRTVTSHCIELRPIDPDCAIQGHANHLRSFPIDAGHRSKPPLMRNHLDVPPETALKKRIALSCQWASFNAPYRKHYGRPTTESTSKCLPAAALSKSRE